MDFLELNKRVMRLLTSGLFGEAESELQKARVQASEQSDQYTLELVLSELAHLYCLMQPPDFPKAEMYCMERERVNPRSQPKLQTAMMYYWSQHDPERTIQKLQETVGAARNEGDTVTLYQSLALWGLALLDLDKTPQAVLLLSDLQDIIAARKPIVVGDETLFLERLSTKTAESHTRGLIRDIASTLWPVCRDAGFAARLKTLAEG